MKSALINRALHVSFVSLARVLFLAAPIAAFIAAPGLGCSQPGSAPGSAEFEAPTRSPARASAQADFSAPAPAPAPAPEAWASAFVAASPPSVAAAPADPAAAAARAARQQAQVNDFAQRSGRAGLLLRAENQDALVPGPVLGTEVDIRVTGPIARVHVRQRFQNPSREWVEGLYIFPLPGDAAVDHMRVITGGRTLEGEIQEKKKAQAAYVKARSEGKQAGLVEWQRPNLFSTAVANIEPGGEVTVEIVYQQSLAPDSGQWRLRFPLARARSREASGASIPGPASSPAPSPAPMPASSPAPSPGRLPGFVGDIADAADLVGDPVDDLVDDLMDDLVDNLVDAPLGPSEPPRHPVSIRVDLAPGFETYTPTSPYHRISSEPHAGGFRVELAEGENENENEVEVEAERDFVLRWRALPGRQPQASLFQESWGGRHQALLILMPPHPEGPWRAGPRRAVTFVIDTSGSMAGTSMDQARSALRAGIQALTPDDRFNVLAFSGSVDALFGSAMPAVPESQKKALDFIDALEAKGSTEMEAALERALRPARVEADRVRQVVFMTDGGVPGPDALHDSIRRWVGDSRIFMVGIGSAPNEHFMRKAARLGRGTYTAIGKPEEVAEAMLGLFEKLGSVVLSEIELELPSGVDAEIHPARVGDLYRGEPLVVALESDQPLSWLGVKGRAAHAPWRVTVERRDAEDRPGVHVLWARRKLGALVDTIRTTGDPDGKAIEAATALALDHHLVSPYTSLVAVEQIPRRHGHARWVQKAVPTPVASDSAPRLAVRFAQGATPAAWQLWTGVAGLALAWAVARARRGLA